MEHGIWKNGTGFLINNVIGSFGVNIIWRRRLLEQDDNTYMLTRGGGLYAGNNEVRNSRKKMAVLE